MCKTKNKKEKVEELFIPILELCVKEAMKAPNFPEPDSPKFDCASKGILAFALNTWELAVKRKIKFSKIKPIIENLNLAEVFNDV